MPERKSQKPDNPIVDIRQHRGKRSGIYVNSEDAAIALAMIKRGDRKHDIASFFGWNAARLYDIADGKRFPDLKPFQGELPPPGPYMNGRDALEANKMLERSISILTKHRDALNRELDRQAMIEVRDKMNEDIKDLEFSMSMMALKCLKN